MPVWHGCRKWRSTIRTSAERLSAWRLPPEFTGRDPLRMAPPVPPTPLERAQDEHGYPPELEHYGRQEWVRSHRLAERLRSHTLAGVHSSEVAPALASVLLD